MLDLDDKIARASRAFGALKKSVFRLTKKIVYQAVVLSVLLCNMAETWPAKQNDIRKSIVGPRAFTIAVCEVF